MKKRLLILLSVLTLSLFACQDPTNDPDSVTSSVEESSSESSMDETDEAVTSSEESQESSEANSEESSENQASETSASEESREASSEESSAEENTSSDGASGKDDESQLQVALYWMKDNGQEMYLVREVHCVDKTDQVARAAMEELIKGRIQAQDAMRPIPEDTEILGIHIENGNAVIDFSEEVLDMNVGAEGEALGIQAIVNTLTEFPTIDTVEFSVEGSKDKAADWWGHVGIGGAAFQRDLSSVYEPAIWVDSPQEGQVVGDSIRVTGSMMVFENNAGYSLKDAAGKVLAEGTFMGNTDPYGVRNGFDFTIRPDQSDEKTGVLSIYGFSGKDGSPTDTVEIPLRLGQ